MTAPANQQQPFTSSPIAGTVLPIKRAEELLATLPGVIAARIVASESGAVDEIHVLTTSEVTPKQTVRNVESALIAHLGMRVDHRKISVATTIETAKAREARESARDAARDAALAETARAQEPVREPEAAPAPREAAGAAQASAEEPPPQPSAAQPRRKAEVPVEVTPELEGKGGRPRILLFENVEVRRSRAKGVTWRVTLRKGSESFSGESGGLENERSRIEHVARAALEAIKGAEGDDRHLTLEGCKVIEAFERQFAFVGVTAHVERDAALLTGSCEIKDSAETAAVLAVLDATNRWIARSE